MVMFLQYLKLLEMKLIGTKMYQRFLDKVSIQIIQELIKLWIRFDSGVNFIQKKTKKKYVMIINSLKHHKEWLH